MFTRWLTFYVLLLCCILPSTLWSLLNGGTVMVGPKRGGLLTNQCWATDLEVEVTSRLTARWASSSDAVYCDSNISMTFNCQYGCQDTVKLPFFCAHRYFNGSDWNYYEFFSHENYMVIVSDINAVTISYSSTLYYHYEIVNISTTFSLVPRDDTGKINSSPRVANSPKLQLLEGHECTIPLAVIDPDGDDIRCRWAVGVECFSVCNGIPGAILDPNSCTITYHANNGTGLKPIAIMIEDFLPFSSVPLSSVAHRFLLEVVDSSRLLCPSLPQFVTAPRRTLCIEPNTLYTEDFVATSGCANVSIAFIEVIAPIGARRGALQHIPGTNNYYTNITWMPTAQQQNDTHFLCYIAVSSEIISSAQSCVKLAVGYHSPAPLPESATPNHQFVYPSNNTLHIIFNRKIQRPSKSSFIRVHSLGEMVYQIDASSSLEIHFNGTNLTITPNYVFTEGNSYYINFDDRVIESIEECHSGNDSLLSKTFWTFEVLDLLPDVIVLSNQTLGQPLILQCSVTAIRDINSRVDFVWTSNGTELERVEGATGISSTSNLAVYTRYYIISQLSIADNNSLYTCEVIINRSPTLSSSTNLTLIVNEVTVMDTLESNDDDDDDDDDDNNNTGIIFITLFAISVSINLLICLITLSYYWKRNYRKNDSNQTGASDVVTFENFSLQSPTGQQPVKPAQEDNVKIEQNPPYAGVDCSNP